MGLVRQRTVAAAVFAGLVLSTAIARAEETPPSGPCDDDVARLCTDVGSFQAITQCIQDKHDQLSERCTEAIARERERNEQAQKRFFDRCGTDLERLCAGVELGDGRLRSCLLSHRAELSEGCEGFISPKRPPNERLLKFQAACGEYIRRFCTNVELGPGGVVFCLGEWWDDLSEECRSVLPHQRVVRPEPKGPDAAEGTDLEQ
jgi:hypothetical protein